MTAAGDLSALAIDFLTVVRAGDDRAVEMAARLAERVLDASGARLAVGVLEGGPLAITRAIRLAEQVLRAEAAHTRRKEGAS